MRKVWSGTPWMVNAYTGGEHGDADRERCILKWCAHHLGPESHPLLGREGNWHRGHVTMHGWTWMGFATEAMMKRFLEVWPPPEVSPEARDL